jgi:hypothetical protein
MTRNEWGDYVDEDREALNELDGQRLYLDLCRKWDLGVILSAPEDSAPAATR